MRPSAPPEAARRFHTEAVRLALSAGQRLGNGPVAIAVSGGPDSLALLLLASAAFPGRVLALTVDHGLRPESAGEAALVARLCADMGVEHRTLRVSELQGRRANIQAGARAARYAAMASACGQAGAAVLMTAHHADDQAETLLMRLARGSGLAGLSGVRASRVADGIVLLRPLLGWRKAELMALVHAAGLTPVDDPSNRSPVYDRTAARALLAGEGGNRLDPLRMAAAASHLADAETALQWTAEQAWRGRAEQAGDGAVLVDTEALPRELVRRLVLAAIAALDPGACPDGPAIDRLIARLEGGRPSTLAGIRVSPGRKWRFAPAPPRRNDNRGATHCS